MSNAPTDEINRIIIGLGGQGSRIVNEVRKAVEAQGGLPQGLEFIAVDSDLISLSNLDSVPEDQRVHLAAPDDNITETVVPWLPHEFRPRAGGGCGMQRLTGKGMYLVHRHRVLETVRNVARKLRQRTQVSNFMVVVVNAFGGGTGSGMAIDFSIDVRADLKEITGQDPVLFGLGILPSRSETIQRANGVASIKELHQLLSRKEPFVVSGRDISNPFELYFLVGREVMGIERDDELLKSIVRFTIDLGLIPSTSRDAAAAGKGAGWVDLQDIRTLVKGAGHMFSTFGYYRASFPAAELLEWFDVRDKIGRLKKDLPSLTTDAHAQKQALEDKRIALADAEETLRLAKARAARLRNDGVMGANRSELAKFLGEIGRAEDDLRKARKELAAVEEGLPGLNGRHETLEAELRELELRAEALKTLIVSPTQTRTSYSFPLTEAECGFLAENRHLLTEGTLRSVMEALGRSPDYLDKTMEVVGKSKILQMPLLNYRMSVATAASVSPPVLGALRRHGFVKSDASGNPVIGDDQLWMIMAMVSSCPDNIDASKVSARAFKEIVEGHVARRAEVKIVPSTAKRFEVVIHSWLIGLQVAPIAPGYPPRLRELEWLQPEYDQVAREGGLAQHHAFLYGDPAAFSRLTGRSIDATDPAHAHGVVTRYWSTYAPVDSHARWQQLPLLLGETLTVFEDLGAAVSPLANVAADHATDETDLATVERLAATLAQGNDKVDAFGRTCVELRERLMPLATQLEQATAGPRDADSLISMDELAAQAQETGLAASSALGHLRTDLEALAPPAVPSGATTRGRVRHEHAAAQAHAHAARLAYATGAALAHLETFDGELQRIRDTLRARSLATIHQTHTGPPLRLAKPSVASQNGHYPEEHA